MRKLGIVAVAAGAIGLGQVPAERAMPTAVATQQSAPVTEARVLSSEDWFNSLRSERAWQARRSSSAAAPSPSSKQPPPPSFWGLFGPPGYDPDEPLLQSRGGSYRTVCVRLCDGYYFPISASTTREHFAADEATCESRCSSGAKLYVMRNPDGSADDMVDLRGQPYSKLKTAFLYRTAYDASCKCKPHPWEQEARLQHRVYALEEQRRKGSKQAVAELKEIRKSGTLPEPEKGKKRSRSTATGVAVAGGEPFATASGKSVAAPTDAPAADEAVARRQKLAAMPERPGQKAMRLGAAPSSAAPSANSTGRDWRARALSPP